MNKKTLIELSNICKEARELQGVSLEELKFRTKIPVDILQYLENDVIFLEQNYPYSKFLLKVIARSLNIDISELEKNLQDKDDIENISRFDLERLKKAVNTSLTSLLAFSTLIYAATLNNNKEKNNNFYNFLTLISSNSEEKADSNSQIRENDEVLEPIEIKFIATGDSWITAYIDGEEKVIKLKKGDEKTVKFFYKIKVETLGNPQNLKVSFKNKIVKFKDKRKIIHNIFIDKDGIFVNGYNLLYSQVEE